MLAGRGQDEFKEAQGVRATRTAGGIERPLGLPRVLAPTVVHQVTVTLHDEHGVVVTQRQGLQHRAPTQPRLDVTVLCEAEDPAFCVHHPVPISNPLIGTERAAKVMAHIGAL